MNVRAAFIHVLGDFLQSVGVFLAALLIWFKVGLFRASIRSINCLDTEQCFSRVALLDTLSTKKMAARFNWAKELCRVQPESP